MKLQITKYNQSIWKNAGWVILILMITLFLPLSVHAVDPIDDPYNGNPPFTIPDPPNVFGANTPASANDVNANFETLRKKINEIIGSLPSSSLPTCAVGQIIQADANGGYVCANPPSTTLPVCNDGDILLHQDNQFECEPIPSCTTNEVLKWDGSIFSCEDISSSGEFTCGFSAVTYGGKTYNTVLIGNQCWMATNLEYSDDCSNATWANNEDRGWCGPSSATNGGYLYQWGAVMDGAFSCNGDSTIPACSQPVQGICPVGWHMPSHYEFVALERAVCDSSTCTSDFPYDYSMGWAGTNEGAKLKTGGSSGFNAIFAGERKGDTGTYASESYAFFWTSTQLNGTNSRVTYYMNSNNGTIARNTYNTNQAFSVRCIKN